MIALPIILAILMVIGIRFSRFHDDYMGVSQTTAIKGIFAVIIVMSHLLGYVTLSHPTEEIYRTVINHIGQLMVAPFFFYSGYGVFVSYKKKSDYYDTFLKNRLLKTLVHFDLAVLLFFILSIVLSASYSKADYITCWIGWGSVGNSNWFVFDTLVLYFLAFVAMVIRENTKTDLRIFAAVLTVLCVVFWAVMAIVKGNGIYAYWYDTVLCFPAGVWYALCKDKIDAIAKKWYFYIPVLALLTVLFVYLYNRRIYVDYFSILAPVFCVLLTWITMKIRINNPVLRWLGKHSFSIYIIQRIPMILIHHFGLHKNHIVYVVLVVVTVFPLAWLFSWCLGKVDKLLFKKKKTS